ncbi:hypothetical protein M2140_000883 [Clostridiales Family XIII bacterium PM5-7]
MKKKSSYCRDLIEKLEQEGYAVWNLIEILPLGDFINLYRLFYEEFPEAKNGINFTYPMLSIKNLRNAAAHNNCILNQLTKGVPSEVHTNGKITSYVSSIPTISKDHRKNCMKMQAVHDFVTLLFVLDNAVESEGVKRKIIEELRELINVRMLKHKDYFKTNNELKTVHEFIKKIVDSFPDS